MRWLVRTITRKRQDAIAYSDETHVGEALTIGRAAGQAVFLSDLRVALEHARVVALKQRRFRVESLITAGVRVDGKLQHAAGAGLGSQIEIGPYTLRLVKPPKDYDAAVEVDGTSVSTSQPSAPFADKPFTLQQTWLSKRMPSWLLLLVTLSLGLLIPVAAHYSQAVNAIVSQTSLPDTSWWQSGPLHSAHQFFGQDCASCHSRPFKRVQDRACASCHRSTEVHADAAFFNLPALAETRCASCHKDHNGRNGLVRTDQTFCQHCHDDLDSSTGGQTTLQNVSDFGHAHPQFTVELAGFSRSGEYQPRREPLDSPTLVEDSQLKFPHDIHLSEEGLNAADGQRVLTCHDCHQAEPGGDKMQAVNFETMCQDCHRLAFDAQSPQRQVPHGQVAEVLYMLEEYYGNKALVGGYADVTAPTVVRQRRRPGQRLSREEKQLALDWARGKSRRVGQDLFEGQACSVCHQVESVAAADQISWRVAPVRVAGIWFSKASFTHARHRTMTCDDCHAARQSQVSDDVLIPGIENCRTCHAGQRARGKVATSCIGCHRYHARNEGTPALDSRLDSGILKLGEQQQ